MAYNNEKRRWIPVMKAARLLDVHYDTIRQWMRVGRVIFKPGKYNNRRTNLVLTSSLATAFDVKCKYCGKIIQTRRPEKTKFCSAKHKHAWVDWPRLKGYGNRGRPRNGEKPSLRGIRPEYSS